MGWRSLDRLSIWFAPDERAKSYIAGVDMATDRVDDKTDLLRSIEDRTARLVILGLGYVGLPVACLFAEAGFPVVGIRRSQAKVDMINRGECPIGGDEPGLSELLAAVVGTGRFEATIDYAPCRDADVVLIAVETPVDLATKKPGYEALRGALSDLGRYLQPGSLVIIESTIAPGTMADVVRPLLESVSGLVAGDRDQPGDFYLANCPERVMPGKLLRNIRELNRVVGGMSPDAAELAVALYRHVVRGDLDPVDSVTAEIVKTAENAYRDVQIAFANELALICDDMGSDVWQVRELVNKCPYRSVHMPGAGVGGHCLPKDSWLLLAGVHKGLQNGLLPAARAVNEYMPRHMFDLTQRALAQVGVNVAGARVAVLGYAYLENSDDERNTPTKPLVEALRQAGAEVELHDPHVHRFNGSLDRALQDADCAVIMVRHDPYREMDLAALRTKMRHPILVDGRNVFDKAEARAAGFVYYGVGNTI
jgi:UDP-N-acetyl-D-mannosaminuronic acid dehydrogenase